MFQNPQLKAKYKILVMDDQDREFWYDARMYCRLEAKTIMNGIAASFRQRGAFYFYSPKPGEFEAYCGNGNTGYMGGARIVEVE